MKNIERYSLAFFYWALGLIFANLIVQPGIIGKTVHVLEIELPTYLNMHQHSGALLYLYAHVFVLKMLILTPVFLLVVSILRVIQKQASVFSLYTIPSIAVLGVFFEHVFIGAPTFQSIAPHAPLMMLGGTIYFVGLLLCFLVIAVASLDRRFSCKKSEIKESSHVN